MKTNTFQIVVLAVFGVLLVAGLIVLATSKSRGGGADSIPIVVWGTASAPDFNRAIKELTEGSNGLKITYVEKRPESFDQELLESLAGGRGPDAILLPQDLIVRHRDKILPLSYGTMSIRAFKDNFIQEGELYLGSDGIIAVPFSVDPLVMYWNRDLLGNAGIAKPPAAWDEFITLAPRLTVKDKTLNILKSAVALGEFRNITNAKEIISALLMQAGNPIVKIQPSEGGFEVALSTAGLGAIGAVNFYTDFANPVKPDYSWNRALPNSRDLFAAGDLAFYFGFASELPKIRNKNPNLNFDAAYFPQPKGAKTSLTFGRMFGLAVLRNSRNPGPAFNDVLAITSPAVILRWSDSAGLPPVRRDLLAASPADSYQSVFYNSALFARAWLDPNPAESAAIFRTMIESITSGESAAGAAIESAGQALKNIFP